MKKRVLAGVAAIAAAAAIGAICLSRAGEKESSALPVEIKKAVSGEMITKVRVSGTAALKEPVRIYASNTGKIKQVLVSEGDYVNKGQTLFTYDEDNTDDIDNSIQEARLEVSRIEQELKGLALPAEESELRAAQAEITQYQSSLKETEYSLEIDQTNLDKAETDLSRAREDYEKNKQLFDSGVIAQSELNTYTDRVTECSAQYENAKTQLNRDRLSYSATQDNLAAAEAKYGELRAKPDTASIQNQISVTKVQLEEAKLKVRELEKEYAKYKTEEAAPFSGRVSAVNQNDGATVLEDTAVLEMVNENDMDIYVDIPEADMPGIKEGLEVILTGDGFEGEINARIKSVKFEAEEKQINNVNKSVVEAEIEVEPQDRLLLRPGYSLKADIIKAVDSAAVLISVTDYLTDEENGKDYVYIVNSENKLEKRFITIKNYSDMNISVEGIAEGERLAASPDGELLTEGALVTDKGASE